MPMLEPRSKYDFSTHSHNELAGYQLSVNMMYPHNDDWTDGECWTDFDNAEEVRQFCKEILSMLDRLESVPIGQRAEEAGRILKEANQAVPV